MKTLFDLFKPISRCFGSASYTLIDQEVTPCDLVSRPAHWKELRLIQPEEFNAIVDGNELILRQVIVTRNLYLQSEGQGDTLLHALLDVQMMALRPTRGPIEKRFPEIVRFGRLVRLLVAAYPELRSLRNTQEGLPPVQLQATDKQCPWLAKTSNKDEHRAAQLCFATLKASVSDNPEDNEADRVALEKIREKFNLPECGGSKLEENSHLKQAKTPSRWPRGASEEENKEKKDAAELAQKRFCFSNRKPTTGGDPEAQAGSDEALKFVYKPV